MSHHSSSEWVASYFQLYAAETIQSLYTTSNMPLYTLQEPRTLLLAVARGRGTLESGGSRYALDAGSVLLIPANQQVLLATEGLYQIHVYVMAMDIREPADVLLNGALMRKSALTSISTIQVFAQEFRIVEQLEELYIHRLPNNEVRHMNNQILFHQILLSLLEQMKSGHGEGGQPSIERSIFYLENYFHEKLSREQLSEIAGVSPSHYSTLFKQLTGFSPHEYLSRLRVHRAKEILLGEAYSLRETALKVGYKDEFYLSRRFKQQTGETPSTYSRRTVRRVAVWLAPYASHLQLLGLEPAVTVSESSEYIFSEEFPLSHGTRFIDADSSLEQVKSSFLDANVELIIAASQHLHEKGLSPARLRVVAPVVEIPWMELGWKEHLRLVAQTVRRGEEAERWLALFEQEEEQARLIIRNSETADEVVTILVIKPEKLQVYGARNIGYVIYRSLGLRAPSRIEREIRQAGDQFHSLLIDISELAEYDGSRLLVILFPDEKGSTMYSESIFRSVHWNSLEAVKRQQVHMLQEDEWIPYNPISIRMQLQRALELFSQSHK